MNETIKTLKQLKKAYEDVRFHVAKEAHSAIMAVIDEWENQEKIEISFFWDGVLEVDGIQYDRSDFEGENV